MWRTCEPDAAAELGMLPRPALKILYGLEGIAYRHARLVTTLTAAMKERIASKGVAAEKIELLEPRMDESLASTAPSEALAFCRRYGLDGKFLVTYSGNIGVKQRLDVVIDAAALNRDDDSMLFLIVGDGADRGRIQGRAAELELRNVRFLPLMSHADFRGLLAASGICLVTQQKSGAEIAFPSKIVTYLAAGRPVVASVDPENEVARITQESGAGRVATAEDPAALLSAILELRGANLREIGANGHRYAAQRWSSKRVLDHLERSLADAAFDRTNGSPGESMMNRLNLRIVIVVLGAMTVFAAVCRAQLDDSLPATKSSGAAYGQDSGSSADSGQASTGGAASGEGASGSAENGQGAGAGTGQTVTAATAEASRWTAGASSFTPASDGAWGGKTADFGTSDAKSWTAEEGNFGESVQRGGIWREKALLCRPGSLQLLPEYNRVRAQPGLQAGSRASGPGRWKKLAAHPPGSHTTQTRRAHRRGRAWCHGSAHFTGAPGAASMGFGSGSDSGSGSSSSPGSGSGVPPQ